MSEAEASAMDALVDEVMDGRKAKEIASAPAAAVGAAAAEPGPMLNDDGPKDSNESSTPSIGFADPTEGVETEGETLDGDEVAVLRSERDGYLADSQRLAADFANYRKQSEKRVSDIAATQSAGLVRDLILVLDACDAALMQDSESAAGPIRTQLLSELTKNGLNA